MFDSWLCCCCCCCCCKGRRSRAPRCGKSSWEILRLGWNTFDDFGFNLWPTQVVRSSLDIFDHDLSNMQDCHNRAWEAIQAYLEGNLMVFPGRQGDAKSTMMPSVRSWMRHVMEDDCISVEDHSVILWLNCPCIGILPTLKYDFFLTFISNMLAEFPRNGICFIIYPNRATQLDRRRELY